MIDFTHCLTLSFWGPNLGPLGPLLENTQTQNTLAVSSCMSLLPICKTFYFIIIIIILFIIVLVFFLIIIIILY